MLKWLIIALVFFIVVFYNIPHNKGVPMITALYSRVSTLEQNYEMQEADLLKYAEFRGFENIQVFSDKESGMEMDRPQLNQLLAMVRQGKVKTIVIWKLDRFFRSVLHLANIANELKNLGVNLISIKDNIDLQSATGELMFHILGAFSQYEFQAIKLRQQAGIKNALKKGVKWGRAITVNHQRIYNLRYQGYSISEIAREMKCAKSTVSRVLKSEYEKLQKLAQISEPA